MVRKESYPDASGLVMIEPAIVRNYALTISMPGLALNRRSQDFLEEIVTIWRILVDCCQ